MASDPTLDAYLDDLAARWHLAEDWVAAHPVEGADDASRVRVAVTRTDPLAFALTYLMGHLKGEATGNKLTLAEVHWSWVERAKSWMVTNNEPFADRHAEVGPRDVGKSTWWFLILPLWAAAHEWVKFAAAFADTDTQAQTHLASFKSELDNNATLRADYPDLVVAKTRGRGQVEADRVSLYHAKSGFVFAAAGMDSSNLGMKVGKRRPDLIILDDIEPHEARYSPAIAKKRLATLRDAILPLNIYAHVIAVGTVVMVDSIIHQLVKAAQGQRVEDWVREEQFTAHWYPAIETNDDGSRRSIWPAKWSLAFLESIEGTRTYAKNYANDPVGADGDYWRLEDFVRGAIAGVTRRVLSIDPNVTQKASSDFTGLAVVGWSPSAGKVEVEFATRVKLDPAALRDMVLELCDEYGVGLIVIETNQGGNLWLKILWGMPVKVKTVHQSEPKEVRAARALNHYQRGKVIHRAGLEQAEAELVGFPKAPHDDIVDAIVTAVLYFLSRPKRVPVGNTVASYT